MTTNVVTQSLTACRLTLAIQLVANATHLLNGGFTTLLRLTHHR